MDAVIDVSKLMADVRERVAAKRATGAYGDDPAAVALVIDAEEGLAARAIVTGRRETMAARNPVVTLAQRAAVKAVSPFLEDLLVQINRFHAEVVDAVEGLEDQLKIERNRSRELERRIAQLESRD